MKNDGRIFDLYSFEVVRNILMIILTWIYAALCYQCDVSIRLHIVHTTIYDTGITWFYNSWG